MKEVFGIDIDTWTALNSIAAILSAFGTFAAVIVALRLARRDYEPRLQMHTTIMQIVQMGVSGPKEEVLIITGTNVGQLPVTVKGIFWRFGWIRTQSFLTVPNSNPYSDALPKELAHSQQAKAVMPVSLLLEGFAAFVTYLRGRWYRRFFIRYARCGFYTSTGEFSGRVDSSVSKLIRKAYDAAEP